ncbi:2-polyprenyl-6-methoxyphenol hydroxylase-like FAD-dependent oxidoreductase [Altererythrobacter atlanticus]|uniref:3-hydroxybenzoate 6-hydroxylase 1 n=1 Tax=Croceibacterium atlanticum TaxID=1267766 RepID=A0A0F7KRK3_9SPHN|nr:FAD-dependent oxidoreductase [Croceibacterium atlanticum]AKH41380.1 3-hydroxybenzoate 6-hydroxylase 1 [Croceibacterium atlanticum]MBB5732841.1 2-polyprenyl-6-methoxyphenol hydroxylase-like FAD-dependent oxidoreductase [Croceibacterium atlanticum]
MQNLNILVIGGGIGGLTAAIALRRAGHRVTLIEKDPDWTVYGVGIIQQGNVIRAMDELGLLEDYLAAGVAFDKVAVHLPDGTLAAEVPSPRLSEGYPANLGIGRPALHKVLGDSAIRAGAEIRLGITAKHIDNGADAVGVDFSDGTSASFDIVIGADGVYSETRRMILPEATGPEFTGQSVWRYNFPRPADLDALHVYNGPTGIGLVPISRDLMYMYVTTPEPGNPFYPREGLARAMRAKLSDAPPEIRALAEQITDDDGVVYRPLEAVMLYGPWHNGRVALLGDAVHATTPHLGQGAGMAVEDGIVLAEELTRHATPEAAFQAYRERRFDRCRYIVESSLAICHGQLGKGPPVDNARATAEMFERVAEPI